MPMTLQITCRNCGAPINGSSKRVENRQVGVKGHEGDKVRALGPNDTFPPTGIEEGLTLGESDEPAADFHARALRYFQERADDFPFIQISCAEDECSCAYCLRQKDKIIPTLQATTAMVPPFKECKSASGKCRCTFIAIAKEARRVQGGTSARLEEQV
jgi:hypothetical protein